MKEEVRISLVQFASQWLELENNIKRMRQFVESEAKDGQELIVFPELANLGYITPFMPGDPASPLVRDVPVPGRRERESRPGCQLGRPG